MALARGKLSHAFAPGLAAIYYSRIDKVKKEHTEIVNLPKTPKSAYVEHWKMTGLGPFVKKNEGGVYTFDEPLPGDVIRYTHQTFGLAIRIFLEFIEDEQYGLMNRITAELGKSAALNKEMRAASILNNGFDAAFTGFDGQPLFSTAHANLGGGTQSNRGSADLAIAPLTAAIQAFDTWTDDRGVVEPRTPKKLVVHPSEYMNAVELLDTKTKPGGTAGDLTVNVVATKYNIVPVVNHYLSDPDAWFLLGDDHDMNMFVRKDDSFHNADDPLTDDAIYTGRHRLSEGFGDWRDTYGSPGV